MEDKLWMLSVELTLKTGDVMMSRASNSSMSVLREKKLSLDDKSARWFKHIMHGMQRFLGSV